MMPLCGEWAVTNKKAGPANNGTGMLAKGRTAPLYRFLHDPVVNLDGVEREAKVAGVRSHIYQFQRMDTGRTGISDDVEVCHLVVASTGPCQDVIQRNGRHNPVPKTSFFAALDNGAALDIGEGAMINFHSQCKPQIEGWS
jgi:hypothetical protein